MDHDCEKAVNTKLVLSNLEQLSGLNINFDKCEFLYFGKAKDMAHEYKLILAVSLVPYLFGTLK
jgi:hypothetical protein